LQKNRNFGYLYKNLGIFRSWNPLLFILLASTHQEAALFMPMTLVLGFAGILFLGAGDSVAETDKLAVHRDLLISAIATHSF